MLLVVLTAVVASLVAPQRLPVQLGNPDAQIVGQVIEAESRAPVPDAIVILTLVLPALPAAATGGFQAITDTNGRFVVQGLFAGRYQLQVQKSGFAPLTDPIVARTIDVAAGQSITGLELTLRNAAVIAGRIIDANRHPLFGLSVSALRQTVGPDGRSIAITAQRAETNESGEFRFATLSEGNYLVIAAPGPQPPFTAVVSETVLAPTYYPGTPDTDAAQLITLVSGQTVSGLQFTMVSRAAHRVSGVVVDEAGTPLVRTLVMLMIDPQKGGSATPATGLSDENGRFQIGGIVEGTYRVMTGTPSGRAASVLGGSGGVPAGVTGGVFVAGTTTGPSSSHGTTAASLEITVGNTDVTDLKIVVSSGK
jgi:Carboxypeptidase regulatory-like domain